MHNLQTKIISININNFKNTIEGFLPISSLDNSKLYESDIIGIYGQNGSGKSTIINVMEVFKDLATESQLQNDISDYIMVTKDNTSICISFLISNDSLNKYVVNYTFVIGNMKDNTTLLEEKITYQTILDSEHNLSTDQLLAHMNYIDSNIVSMQSNLFNSHNIKELNEKSQLIINQLKHFAKNHLFIISNKSIVTNSSSFILPNGSDEEIIEITYDKPTKVNKNILDRLVKTITYTNIVLKEIIPNLMIDVEVVSKDEDDYMINIVSLKNELSIPIAYESDGIKKIVSVISVLIALFNNQVTVFIDEIDTGIYEYLLGEILEIVEERAIGQLIFTSHNLRPLEVLSIDKLIFTTNNPNNRYIKLDNVDSSNIRDLYYRDIVLGGQSEEIYAPTKSSRIARAFRKAGHNIE